MHDVRYSRHRNSGLYQNSIEFGQALGDLTRAERELFLRFVWGRSRMPPAAAHDRRDPSPEARFKVDELYKSTPDEFLPTASTCFFTLHLPRYTNAARR